MSELYVDNNDLTTFPVESLAKAVKGRKMSYFDLHENRNLPCGFKGEILDEIQEPSDFNFPTPCDEGACPAPARCTCKGEVIKCGSLGLSTVPNFEFSDLHTTLQLYDNNILEVPSNAFRNLPKLNILSLSFNKRSFVHPNAFDGLSRLLYLYLNNNELQTLRDTIFDPLTKLFELYMDNNKLKDFPVKSLAKAVKGRKMGAFYLEENPNLPCNLKEDILSEIQMPSMFLFPSPCQAEACPAPSPCTCSGIEISCDNNELASVPNFESSHHYTVLTLSTNKIEEVPANAFSNLRQLTHLHIFNNKVTTIHSDALYGLSQLVYLDFGNNQLQTLPDTIFDPLSNLSKLFMDNNKLMNFLVKSLAKAVEGRKMKSLYLQENPNLPCNLKEEILSQMESPSAFNTPSPCGVASSV